jgi:hypothetical protein
VNAAIAHEEVRSRPVTKMISSSLTSKPPASAWSSQLSQCLRIYVSKTLVRIASSRRALKGSDRKAPFPLRHLNEAFGTSSGPLDNAVYQQKDRSNLQLDTYAA